jgi:hypothetical protein
MEETKPTSGGQTIMANTMEKAQLTAGDIQLIKNKFKRKQTITYYCMAVFFIAGALVTAYAIMGYGFSRFENFVPLIVGLVAVIICGLVLFTFNQEIGIELKNNKKIIYRGVVSKRSETATRTGAGKERDTYYSYFIYLGEDIYFEHKDLYFKINVGDAIDVQISEKLKIILQQNIVKDKDVTDVAPEVIAQHGIFQEIREKHKVEERVEFLSEEELAALKTQKKRRLKRILLFALIFLAGFGFTAEIIRSTGNFYSWEEILAIRLGFWGSPLLFFGLLFYRRIMPLTKDIKSGKKIIYLEKLINKDQYTWTSTNETDYYLVGLQGKITVSRELFNTLNAGDDFELYKTLIRRKLLYALNPKTQFRFYNPDIFGKGRKLG